MPQQKKHRTNGAGGLKTAMKTARETFDAFLRHQQKLAMKSPKGILTEHETVETDNKGGKMKTYDLQAAFQIYLDLRKLWTDRVTATSNEAEKLASAGSPDQMTNNSNPDALTECMKWIMEYNVLEDLREKGQGIWTSMTRTCEGYCVECR